jgi:two-component system, NtrC family, response regulator GlrR
MRPEHYVEDRDERKAADQHQADDCQAMDSVSLLRGLHLVGQTRPHDAVLQEIKRKLGLSQLIGESPAFLAAVSKIPTIARCEANVLISGETGTGKEVCARAIHYLSSRSSQPFIAVNCGAIPAELIENELFGHERGAYTDAAVAKPGLIQEAEGGTLFLDEIDCLSLAAQVKLLRFLQEKEYRPLGATKTKTASVRIITATNANLADAVHQGTLRQDLYYRINILPLVLPPLRDRPEDVVPLAQHFLAKFAAEFAKPVADYSPEVLRMLRAYSWPGNIRELEHTIERAVALTDDLTLSEADVGLFTENPPPPPLESFQIAKDRAVIQFEHAYLTEVLLAHAGNITQAAQAAGKNRRAFWQLLHKHGLATHSVPAPPAPDLDKG